MIGCIFIVLLWWAIGSGGFIFWWTHDFDLDTGDLVAGLGIGVLGPLTWLMGYFIHGRSGHESKVIISKRIR